MAFAVIAGPLLAIALAAPTALSTGAGTRLIERAVAAATGGSLEIGALSLAWFDGQAADDLSWADAESKSTVQLASLRTELSLWRALTGNLGLGKTTIEGLDASFVIEPTGAPSAEEPAGATRRPQLPKSLAVDAELRGASVTLRFPGEDPVRIDGLDAGLVLGSRADPVTFHCVGGFRQGALAGSFRGEGKVHELFAADGSLRIDRARATLELATDRVPSAGLDRLLGLDGVMSAALGETIDLNLVADGTADVQDVDLSLESPLLGLALAARVRDETLELVRPASIRSTVTGELVGKLASMRGEPVTIGLREPVGLDVVVERLGVGLAGFDPSRTGLRASLRLADAARFAGDPRLEDLALLELEAAIDSAALSDAVQLQLVARLDQGGEPGSVRVEGELRDLWDAKGELRLDRLAVDAVAKVEGLSSALVDRLAGREAFATELLGPRLALDATASQAGEVEGGFDVELALRSERLSTDAIALSFADRVTLRRPASVRATVSPGLVASLAPDAGLPRPAEPVALTLALEELSAPLPGPDEAFLRPRDTRLRAALSAGAIRLADVPELGELRADGLSVVLAGDSLAALEVAGSVRVGSPGGESALHELLGPGPLAIELGARGGIDDEARPLATEVTLAVEGERLSARALLALPATLDSVALREPATLRAVVTPALAARYGAGDLLTAATPVSVTVDELGAPLGGLAADELDLGDARVVARVRVEAPAPGEPLAVLLGERVELALSLAGADPGAELAAKLTSENASLDATGRVDPRLEAFTLSAPASLAARVSPRALAILGVSTVALSGLSEPLPIEMRVGEARVPLADFSLAGLSAQAEVSLGRLDLPPTAGAEAASVRDTRATVTFDGPKGSLVADLHGSASVSEDAPPSPFRIEARAGELLSGTGLDLARASVDANARFEELPTALLDAVAPIGERPGAWSELFGPTLDIGARAGLRALEPPAGDVDLRVSSVRLKAEAAFELDEMIVLQKPASVRLELTPRAFAQLTTPATPTPTPTDGSWSLSEPTVVVAAIDSLRWPVPGGRGFDPARAAVEASVTSGLRLAEKGSGAVVILEGFQATARAKSLADPLDVAVGAWLGVARPDPPGARNLQLTARLADLLGPDGAVDLAGLSADWKADVAQLPVKAVDGLLELDGLLLAALGSTARLTADGRLARGEGPLRARLDASNARARLDAALAGGALRLVEPLTVEVGATPEVGRVLLGRLHPFLRGIYGEEPVVLEVAPQDVHVPLAGFELARLVVPRAEVRIGRVTIENDVVLQGLVQLAGRGNPQNMPAWFTPAVFSVRDGRARFEQRLDILIDRSLHVATWGTSDLEQGTYEQTLALTGVTLRRALGLRNVDPEDMLRIPIRGTYERPKVDYAGAAASLASLQAQDAALSELLDKLGDIPFGKNLLKSQIDKLTRELTRALGGDARAEPPPPPAPRPFPWERAESPESPGDTRK